MLVDAVDGTKLAIRATPVKRRCGRTRQVETPNQKHTKGAYRQADSDYSCYTDGDQTVSFKKQF